MKLSEEEKQKRYPYIGYQEGFEMLLENFTLSYLDDLEKQVMEYEHMDNETWNKIREDNGGFAPRVICWYEGLESTEEYCNI